MSEKENQKALSELFEYARNCSISLIKTSFIDNSEKLNNLINFVQTKLEEDVVLNSKEIFDSFTKYGIIASWLICEKEETEILNELLIKFDNTFEDRLFLVDEEGFLLKYLKQIFYTE